MSFAVVKFLNEGDSEDEIISEVPLQWLIKENKFCKWPNDTKYTSIYISKNIAPQPDWEEYPVEVETICDSLAEAKLKVMGGGKNEKVGRGFRRIKPRDYFSPAEEEEKHKGKKKETVLKNSNENFEMNNFMADMNITLQCTESENQFYENPDELLLELEGPGNDRTKNFEDFANVSPDDPNSSDNDHTLTSNDAGSIENIPKTDSDSNPSIVTILSSDILDQSQKNIDEKLTAIISFLAELKLDLTEIKQRLDDVSPPKEVCEEEKLLMELPLKTLKDLEGFEKLIQSNMDQKHIFIKFLNQIGGTTFKDFTVRICRSSFSNNLAEMCSITGRKNNFPVGDLTLIKIMFGVVHNKTKCTKKQFEEVLGEWLRHGKQRRLREEK